MGQTGVEKLDEIADCGFCGRRLYKSKAENNGFVDYVHCDDCDYDWQLWKLRWKPVATRRGEGVSNA